MVRISHAAGYTSCVLCAANILATPRLPTWYCVVNRGARGSSLCLLLWVRCCTPLRRSIAHPGQLALRLRWAARPTCTAEFRYISDFRIAGDSDSPTVLHVPTVWTPEASFACLLAPPEASKLYHRVLPTTLMPQRGGHRGFEVLPTIAQEIRLHSRFEKRIWARTASRTIPRHPQRFRHLISWRPLLFAPPTAICTTMSLK